MGNRGQTSRVAGLVFSMFAVCACFALSFARVAYDRTGDPRVWWMFGWGPLIILGLLSALFLLAYVATIAGTHEVQGRYEPERGDAPHRAHVPRWHGVRRER